MNKTNVFENLLEQAQSVIKGKEEVLKLAFYSFFSGGHLLIEDLPGVGKTTLSKTLARLLNLDFKRIQMTNDLLPSDILGYKFYSPEKNSFVMEKGPIFTQVLLTDELNRASPKTQSALLEAMEEKAISLEGERFDLSENFYVIATQNPFGQIGTFPLPESQLDRFCMKISIGAPEPAVEMSLLMGENPVHSIEKIHPVFNDLSEIQQIKASIQKVHVSESLSQYIVALLNASRNNDQFHPLSPRAGLDMVQLVKTKAFFEGREFANSDDVLYFAKFVFGHRLLPTLQANVAEAEQVVAKLLELIKAP